MFENYTEIAKQTIFFAKGEAAELGSPEIGAEHILLGLLRDEAVTGRLMEGLSASQIRQDILARAPRRQKPPGPVDLPLSTQSRELLALAEEEAQGSPRGNVSNVHILLWLLRARDSQASQLLQSKGLSADRGRSLMTATPSHKDATAARRAESSRLSNVAANLPAEGDLRRLMLETIPQVNELSSRGEQRNALKLLDNIMAESVPDRSLRIRHLAPLATATARSLGDFQLVKHYCELRLANDPNDAMALYGLP